MSPYIFENPFALGLLLLLLFGSFIIGLLSRRGIQTAQDFLFARDMKWYDFALNSIGTNLSISGGIVLAVGYAYQYGWLIGIGIIGSFILGILVYRFFISKSHAVQKFFNDRQGYSLISFIVQNYQESGSTRAIQGVLAFAIIVSYWATFAAELLAIEKILGPFWQGNVKFLAVAAGIICVFYTILGGYRSVFRTDGFQTGILGIAIVLFSVSVIGSSVNTWPEMFKGRPVPSIELWGAVFLLILLGIAFQVTAMDMWVRTGASNRSRTLKEPKYGLIWTMLGGIFFLGILGVGLSAYVFFGGWGNNLDQILPRFLNTLIEQGLSVSIGINVVLVLLFSVALSTADTCLITATQTIYRDFLPSIHPRVSLKLWHTEAIVAFIGLLGILFTFILPGVIEGAFLFAGSQLILIPLLIGAISNKFKNPVAGVTAIVMGLLIVTFLVILGGRSGATVAPIIGLILSCVVFFIINRIGRKTLV